MYLIKVKDDFSAAHYLKWQDGTSEPLHGHNWQVELTVACSELDKNGLGIDYLFLHKQLHQLLNERLDHQNLNLLDAFGTENPTSENVAKWIFDNLKPVIKKKLSSVDIKSVTVWETEQFSVTYEP